MKHNNTNQYYRYNWSKFGKIIRHILNYFGLALEKDWAYCDAMWINALNHCATGLLDKNTSIKVKENLAELMVLIDEDGKEFINGWYKDFEKVNNGYDNKFTINYINALKEICPLLEKYQKQYRLGKYMVEE